MIEFGEAQEHEIADVVHLLHDDPFGATRESPDAAGLEPYLAAFRAIAADDNNQLVVGRGDDRNVVAVAQLTFLPSMTYGGSWRAQIEGVRVARQLRRQGVAKAFFAHLIDLARARGCRLVQLTTDKRRPEALAFYERLGFAATHEGMKLSLV
jgi:GNAT superfamily N-acetyltransferase